MTARETVGLAFLLFAVLMFLMAKAIERAGRDRSCRARLIDKDGEHACTGERHHLGDHVCGCGGTWANRNRPRVEVLNPRIYGEGTSLGEVR